MRWQWCWRRVARMLKKKKKRCRTDKDSREGVLSCIWCGQWLRQSDMAGGQGERSRRLQWDSHRPHSGHLTLQRWPALGQNRHGKCDTRQEVAERTGCSFTGCLPSEGATCFTSGDCWIQTYDTQQMTLMKLKKMSFTIFREAGTLCEGLLNSGLGAFWLLYSLILFVFFMFFGVMQQCNFSIWDQ